MKNLLVRFDELLWSSPMPGIRKKEIVINEQKLRLVEFSEDFVEADWCAKGHIGYIIDGEMHLDFNGTKVHYKKGDGVFIPEGESTKHKGNIEKGKKALVFLIEKA